MSTIFLKAAERPKSKQKVIGYRLGFSNPDPDDERVDLWGPIYPPTEPVRLKLLRAAEHYNATEGGPVFLGVFPVEAQQ